MKQRNTDIRILQEQPSGMVQYPRGASLSAYVPNQGYYANTLSQKASLFWRILTFLRRWRLLILLFALLGTALAWYYSDKIEDQYRATVTLEFENNIPQFLEESSASLASGRGQEYLATQYILLKSRELTEYIVTELKLDSNSSYADQSLSSESRIAVATTHLQQNIRVIPVKDSRIAYLEVTTNQANDAQKIANLLADTFIDAVKKREVGDIEERKNFLTSRFATTKTKLENAEQDLANYAKANGILEINSTSGERSSLDADAAVALNDALSEAERLRIDAEQEFLEVQASISTENVKESDSLKRLKAKRSDLAVQYEKLLDTFKPSYPKMTQLIKQIDQLDEEIIAEKELLSSAVFAQALSRFNAAIAKERELKERVGELKGNLQNLQEKKVQYAILERAITTARVEYEAIVQQLKRVSILSGVGDYEIRVVDPAVKPVAPFAPNRLKIILFALGLSTLLGLVIAGFLSLLDDTIKTPEDIKLKLGLAVLGIVPKIKGEDNLVVKQLQDPLSGISEAFFSARTALDFSTDQGCPKSILLTSTKPGEGKTSSIVALGTSFAKVGKRTLIIDADMRKPSFVGHLERSIGLSGLLTREADLVANVLESHAPGLHLLPSGVIPPNPAELLSGEKLKNIIREAEGLYDIVIVDSSPVMRFTDAPSLGSICEGTIIIIKSGECRKNMIMRTIAIMRQNQANILGAMLTQFDVKKTGKDYGAYFQNYGESTANLGRKESIRRIDILAPQAGDVET